VLGGDRALAVASAVGAQSEGFRQDERPYGGCVSFAGDGGRLRAACARVSALVSPRFATPSGALSCAPYGAKEERDWRGGCVHPSTCSDCVAVGTLIHRDCSVGSGKRSHVDRAIPSIARRRPAKRQLQSRLANA